MVAIYWSIPNIGPAILLVGFGLGIVFIPWGWILWRYTRAELSGWTLISCIVVSSSAWVTGELVRSWSSLGGPWAMFGNTQWNNRDFLSMASFGGVWIVSLALVAINVAIGLALVGNATGLIKLLSWGLAALMICFGFTFGAIRGDPRPNAHFSVALIQPGPGLSTFPRFQDELRLSRSTLSRHPQLVVWGETSVGFDLARYPGRLRELEQLSALLHCDILVNQDSTTYGPNSKNQGIYKTSLLIDQTGVINSYSKMRLVPFGEYIPFRSELGWLSNISRAASVNRKRGKVAKVMELGVGLPPIGPLICFEETFPDMSRKLAGLDAQILVYQSSDSTFQESWEPDQQASLGAIRAVEDERPTVEVALTGVSGVFDSGGKPLAWLPTSWHGAKVVNVPLTYTTDLFLVWGYWVPYGCVLLLCLAGALYARMRPWRPRE